MHLLRRVLIDSPVSLCGSLLATALGLAVGLPLSRGRVERHGDLIVCHGLPRWAFRRGGTCVGRVYLTRDAVSPAILRHEAVHVLQWRRYGLLMPVLYALAGQDATRNRFEIDAGLADGNYVGRGHPRAEPPELRRTLGEGEPR